MDDKFMLSRLGELARISENRDIFTFSDFLSQTEAAAAYQYMKREDPALARAGMKAWGGMEGCERVMLRFGDEGRIGYEAAFPISILRVSPQNERFSDTLTHRDFLGALMHLGIERHTLGDIFIRDNVAWIFAQEKIAPFIAGELTQVRHTFISCTITDSVPEESRPRRQEMSLNLPSLRMDALVARLYHLPRGKAKELFGAKLVFVNGEICANESLQPKPGDVISVRGHGKLIFDGQTGETKKGRVVAQVQVYV